MSNSAQRKKYSEQRERLRQLEYKNDEALIAFWASVLKVRKCEDALYQTNENVALQLARCNRDSAEKIMAEARQQFLTAKVAAYKRGPR